MNESIMRSNDERKRKALPLIAIILALLLALGVALAYLTDSKSLASGLSLDTNLKIELSEPNWEIARTLNPNYGQNLQPTQRVDKDPTITNIGSIPLYAVARITLPVFSGAIFDPENQTILEVTDHDLFSYSVLSDWEAVDATLTNEERTYTYICNTQLNPNDNMQIFEALYVANLIDHIGIDATNVIVDAFAIQSEGFKDATEAWKAYLHQETDEQDNPAEELEGPLELTEQTEGLSVSKINAGIPDYITKVAFDSTNSEDISYYDDISIQEDRSYLAHVENGETYVITSPENDMIELPIDSSDMFFGLSQITEIDLSGADCSNVIVMDNFLAGTSTEIATTGSAWNTQQVRSSSNFLPMEMQAQNEDGAIVDRDSAFPLASTTYTSVDSFMDPSTGKTYVINNNYLRVMQLPAASSKIYFTDEVMPEDARGADNGTDVFCIDKDGDGGVVCWADTIFFEGQTIDVTKISTQQAGIKPILDRDVSYIFSCKREVLNWTGVDTSKVTNMRGMFKDYYIYAEWYDDKSTINLDGLDTSGATDMSNMFMGDDTLEELDVSSFDTSRVTNMESMFDGVCNLRELDISNFNTKNVAAMNSMFNNCQMLESLDLSNLNTQHLVSMNSMFSDCANLQSLNLYGWNPTRLESMSDAFRNCSILKILDLSTWDVKNSCYGPGAFNNCYELMRIYVGNLKLYAYNDSDVFQSCGKLVGGQGTAYANALVSTDEYARIDDASNGNPGYFTYKANP